MSTNDPLHYRKPEPTPDVMALAEAFEQALRGRSGRIGWDGSYDHGDPPNAAQIASSTIPALGQLGWKLVPVAHERSAGAAPLDVEVLAQAYHAARLRYPEGTYYCGSESGPFEFDSAPCTCAMDMREVAAEYAPINVERLAVVGAARRLLAIHDRVIASDPVTRDDTFAMKNAADDLRDVLREYDLASEGTDR